jgi:hypothetical protein
MIISESRLREPPRDDPDWLPGECTKVICDNGKWFLFYGEDNRYKTEIRGEPQWHRDNNEIKKILGDLRTAWRVYREIVQCGRIDSGGQLIESIREIIDRQNSAEVCQAIKKSAEVRYASESSSSQSNGAMAGALCNMATLWATTRDLAGKRLEILNKAS